MDLQKSLSSINTIEEYEKGALHTLLVKIVELFFTRLGISPTFNTRKPLNHNLMQIIWLRSYELWIIFATWKGDGSKNAFWDLGLELGCSCASFLRRQNFLTKFILLSTNHTYMMISRLHSLDTVMKGKMGTTQQNTTSMQHVIWRWKFDLCLTYTLLSICISNVLFKNIKIW